MDQARQQAAHWTRLSCHRFRANEVRLQLSVLAYNLAHLWRRLVLPRRVENWSLTSLQHPRQDRRPAGQTRTLFLAPAGRESSDPTLVRVDAPADLGVAHADGLTRRESTEHVQLAREFHVHVRTLQAAVRTGRLAAHFSVKSVFGRPRRLATRAATEQFMATHYRRFSGQSACPAPLPTVPHDYDQQLRGLRRRLRLTQDGSARRIGAAGKAVIYQWESRKRTPSPVLWQQVMRLQLVGTDMAVSTHGKRRVEAARRMKIPFQRLNAIIRGRRAVSADTALLLEGLTRWDAQIWLTLQAKSELRHALRVRGRQPRVRALPRLTAEAVG
jgi:addiction module HigA family antidote